MKRKFWKTESGMDAEEHEFTDEEWERLVKNFKDNVSTEVVGSYVKPAVAISITDLDIRRWERDGIAKSFLRLDHHPPHHRP